MKNSSANPNTEVSVKRKTFPSRLYNLVDNAESEGYDHIISWTEDGRAFILKDITLLEEIVLPKHFGHRKIRSLKRQLSYWMFERVSSDAHKYHHPGFIQGKRYLLTTIIRQKFKGVSIKRKGISINLRTTVSVKNKDDAVTALKVADLFCSMQELIATRNLALAHCQSVVPVKAPIPSSNSVQPPRRMNEEFQGQYGCFEKVLDDAYQTQDEGALKFHQDSTSMLACGVTAYSNPSGGDNNVAVLSDELCDTPLQFVTHPRFMESQEPRSTQFGDFQTGSNTTASDPALVPFEGRYFHTIDDSDTRMQREEDNMYLQVTQYSLPTHYEIDGVGLASNSDEESHESSL